jgi:tetratricopeptide (TPR) repeat protein
MKRRVYMKKHQLFSMAMLFCLLLAPAAQAGKANSTVKHVATEDYDDTPDSIAGASAAVTEVKKKGTQPAPAPAPTPAPAAKAAPAANGKQDSKAASKPAEPKLTREQKRAQRLEAEIKASAAEYYEEARSLYLSADLESAEAIADQYLAVDPSNAPMSDLKGRITVIKERAANVKKSVAEEYYYNAKYFFQRENILEALYWIEKSVNLNGKSDKAAMLYIDITEAKERTVKHINECDRDKFARGIKQFLNGKFESSIDIFRDLQPYYTEASEFLNSAKVHLADEKNANRSNEYYEQAVEDMGKERFKSAQEDLLLAVQMYKENLTARYTLEQVDLELALKQAGLAKQ